MPVLLDGESLSFDDIKAVAEEKSVKLAPSVAAKMQASRKVVEKTLVLGKPLYGINTGFGYFSSKTVPKEKLLDLQINLIRSHAVGFGAPFSLPETRLLMALRLNILAKGYTGVRYELAKHLANFLDAEIYPVIPEYGSVGASGDLAPLAHLALGLIGEGKVFYRGSYIETKNALEKSGLSPIILAEKEGLGLINGTQAMLARGSLALIEAFELLELADLAAALTLEAFCGHIDAFLPEIHLLRNQIGEMQTSANILKHLEGSFLHRTDLQRKLIQDPYSLRCTPQIHGASRDALGYAKQVLSRELNAATDNPLVFTESGKILNGGNFHGQPLALALDFACIAISELANVSDRRLELLMNGHLSGLSTFLSPEEGFQSGYMALQYLSASLVNENKGLANPASTDSIPGNMGIEDHVSMGMTAAHKFKKVVFNLKTALAIESLAACQAIDMRGKFPLGKGTQKLYHAIRNNLPPLKEDRILSSDIEKARETLSTIFK